MGACVSVRHQPHQAQAQLNSTAPPQTSTAFQKKYCLPRKSLLHFNGYSEVHEGFNRSSLEPVTVNLIPRSVKNDATTKQFLEAYQACSHPNMTMLREWFVDDKTFYVVMDNLPAEDLVDALTGCHANGFPELNVRAIVSDLLHALDQMHNKNIVHRSVKLENIFITGTGSDAQVKLTDLGFSRFLDPSTKMASTPCGTLGYTAPEVLVRNSETNTIQYGCKSDLFGLGVVMYAIISTMTPWKLESDLYLRPAAIEFSAPCWSNISAEAKNLLTQLLQTRPENRPSVAEALEHPWFSTTFEHSVSPHQWADYLSVPLPRVKSISERALHYGVGIHHASKHLEKNTDLLLAFMGGLNPINSESPVGILKRAEWDLPGLIIDQFLHDTVDPYLLRVPDLPTCLIYPSTSEMTMKHVIDLPNLIPEGPSGKRPVTSAFPKCPNVGTSLTSTSTPYIVDFLKGY